MRRIVGLAAEAVVPDERAILRAQGVSLLVLPNDRTARLVREAIHRFGELAEPVGIIEEITPGEFEVVYRGEGQNEKDAPLEGIYGKADRLALFAVTVGETVCREIGLLISENDFAAAAMLDAAASEGTEQAARAMTSFYHDYLAASGGKGPGAGALEFSPGYCGWDISGQKKLFDFLRPQEIDIQLGESYLMQPLKSISGVIIAGPVEIFEFDDDFPFCEPCRTRSCRDRIRELQDRLSHGDREKER